MEKNNYTIILCSDSHRRLEPMEYLKKTYPNADLYLHCGDSQLDHREMQQFGFASVEGNCDYYKEYPMDRIIPIGTHKIYMVHGHHHVQWGDLTELVIAAKAHGCDICCFGHLHVYIDKEIAGVRLLNPGSCKSNRDGTCPSYMVIKLTENSIEVTRKELTMIY